MLAYLGAAGVNFKVIDSFTLLRPKILKEHKWYTRF